MKFKTTLSVLVVWLGLGFTGSDTAHAAEVAVGGTVTGQVQNVASGMLLVNARVSIKNTQLTAFTDQFGTYRLVNVPSGTNVMEVFYTDLDTQFITIEVPPHGVVQRNIDMTSAARYGTGNATLKLDSFTVTAQRETDAQAIAINEQRFAPNIKNVMAADEVGDVLGSSVGEFLKFVPGLAIEHDGTEPESVNIRGIGGEMTSVTTDGAAEATYFATNSRITDLRGLALNDVSRIEVTKVPTPANPADSLAGSVNLISKSAFERSGRLLRYGLTLGGNSENLTFRKEPDAHVDSEIYKLLPGFNVDFTWPITKNFGVVVTGMHNTNYSESHYARTTWATSGTGTGASLARPYLQQFRLNDGPKRFMRRTLGLKADWRVTPSSVLSLSTRINETKTKYGNMALIFNSGSNGTPTPATGVGMTYGDDHTIGATGRGSYTIQGTPSFTRINNKLATLGYRFDDGRWKIDSTLSYSSAIREGTGSGGTKRMPLPLGSLGATLRVPVRISYLEIKNGLPQKFQAFDANNQVIDIDNIDNYRISAASGSDSGRKTARKFETGKLDVRRRLDLFAFPSALQIGGFHRIETFDHRPARSKAYTFNGPNGTDPLASAAPYQAQVYRNLDFFYGFHSVPWVAPIRAMEAAAADPKLFTQTAAQMVTTETNRIADSEFLRESITALYVQAEATLMSRLQVLTGVRFESTHDEGKGVLIDPNAVFVRNPDGTFARNAAGVRIRKPEAGATNSLEQLRLTHTERGSRSNRTYDGYYPSLHLNYSATENFIVRLAYARTYGRPNFTEIIPRTTVSEADLDEDELLDPTLSRGTLTVRNPALKPWTADNYDISFEYYTRQGGLFSAGAFVKEIRNFFGEQVKIATAEDLAAIGFDPRYEGWTLSSTFNSGDARVSGAEFNFRHSLRPLGRFGEPFTVFANYTRLKLEGSEQASFANFVPKVGNIGVSFSKKRFSITVRLNALGKQRTVAVAAFGPSGAEYVGARKRVDLNLSYQLARRLTLEASVLNLFNSRRILYRYGPETPDYARQYQESDNGILLAVGLKGSF
jgi:iron complex outermembrane recepter protein